MPKYIKRNKVELINEVLKDPDRKSLIRIFSDIFILTLYHKRLPKHYFGRYLFKKGKTNIKDYFPDKFLYYNLKPLFNEKAVSDVVENKLYFNFFYSQFNIKLPEIIFYNHRKMFAKGNQNFEINSVSEFKKYLELIFEQYPSYDSLFIKRTYGSYGGDQVFKITRDHVANDSELIEKLYSIVIKSGFLFQENVKQHPALNKLNPSCLNTIRFDTFIDKDGNVEIISAYLRMSTNNKYVDNIASGGCLVSIDLQSGLLKKEGFPGFSANGILIHMFHPVTKIVFEGFAVPLFEDAKKMVLRAASLMPGLRLVGWDMAIGESGPVLIEGNSDYNMKGNDLSEGGFRANAIFRKMLQEAGYS